MPLSPKEIATLNNHMPTVKKEVEIFLQCLNDSSVDEEKRIPFLIDQAKKISKDVKDVIKILEKQ